MYHANYCTLQGYIHIYLHKYFNIYIFLSLQSSQPVSRLDSFRYSLVYRLFLIKVQRKVCNMIFFLHHVASFAIGSTLDGAATYRSLFFLHDIKSRRFSSGPWPIFSISRYFRHGTSGRIQYRILIQRQCFIGFGDVL